MNTGPMRQILMVGSKEGHVDGFIFDFFATADDDLPEIEFHVGEIIWLYLQKNLCWTSGKRLL
jgi:hypothetical protein